MVWMGSNGISSILIKTRAECENVQIPATIVEFLEITVVQALLAVLLDKYGFLSNLNCFVIEAGCPELGIEQLTA
jgi:hypothetical protein